MSTPQERVVQAGDYRVRVLEAGHGDPLLFLHSAVGAGVWTDGIARLMQEERVLAYEFEGRRYDCGSKLGYLEATVDYGLQHEEVGAAFGRFLAGRRA